LLLLPCFLDFDAITLRRFSPITLSLDFLSRRRHDADFLLRYAMITCRH